ncbi:MAG: prepilin-type N-terminal cleavage/methylation domain-containing protein [Gammaproteobacteria bacterium]|nr:prepilin-type N-terminal cleavage/methylation domain-containing protein [Gammaproteobacteria bacterium]
MAQREKGFTLIELMIAVVIIGIISAFAFPAYTEQVRKARQADTQGALVSLANAMERFFTQNNTFLGASVGTGAGDIFPDEAPLDGTIKYYDLSILAQDGTTYTVRAIPKGAQAGTGCIELLSIGTKNHYAEDDCTGAIDTW